MEEENKLKDFEDTRSRKFFISWNNYPVDLKLEDLMEDLKRLAKVEYCILAFEEGELKHTPHIQGYVRFRNQILYNSVRKLLLNDDGTMGFLTVAYGSDSENFKYCSKQNNYIEYKDELSTLDNLLIDDILSGMGYIDLCKKYFNYVKFHYRDFRSLYFDIKAEIEREANIKTINKSLKISIEAMQELQNENF